MFAKSNAVHETRMESEQFFFLTDRLHLIFAQAEISKNWLKGFSIIHLCAALVALRVAWFHCRVQIALIRFTLLSQGQWGLSICRFS